MITNDDNLPPSEDYLLYRRPLVPGLRALVVFAIEHGFSCERVEDVDGGPRYRLMRGAETVYVHPRDSPGVLRRSIKAALREDRERIRIDNERIARLARHEADERAVEGILARVGA